MDHATDIELIELAAGHLPAARRKAIENHLLRCDSCRGRHDEQAETFQALAQWEAPSGTRDLTSAVMAAAQAQTPARESVSPRNWVRTAMKAAASVLLGIMAGYGAGQMTSRQPEPGGAPSAPAAPDEQAVAASMYLESLETATLAGLAGVVLNTEQLVGNEVPG